MAKHVFLGPENTGRPVFETFPRKRAMPETGKFQTRGETHVWVPKTPFAPRLKLSRDAGDRKVPITGRNTFLGPENTVRPVFETFPEAGGVGDRKALITGRNTFLGPENTVHLVFETCGRCW